MKIKLFLLCQIVCCFGCLGADSPQDTNVATFIKRLTPAEQVELRQRQALQNEAFYSVTNFDEHVLSKTMPDDYAAFRRDFRKAYDTGDALGAIALMEKARGALAAAPINQPRDGDLRKSYQASWRVCVRVFKGSTNAEARVMILDKWNAHLTDSDSLAATQIYAISDRELLTDVFWRRFKESKSRPIVVAVAYTIYSVGNQADGGALNDKLHSDIPMELKIYIQNAINWLNFRLSNNQSIPGLPALAPIPE